MSEIEAVIRKPLMSGHCSSGGSDLTSAGHQKCQRNGGYQRANPAREFQPCPCPCHYDTTDVYECGGCGHEIIEATYWPLDADGDARYTHIDGTGKATGEDCTERVVSRNAEPVDDIGPDEMPSTDEPVEPNPLEDDSADDEFIGLDPEPEEDEPEAEWDDLLAEFDVDDDVEG